MAKDIADNLRAAIAASKLSANELASKTGVSQPTISRFIRGSDMGIKSAAKIAKYLGLKLKP